MKTTFTLPGAADLEKALLALPKGQGAISQEAVLAGARVWASEAKRRVPVETGDLKRSIKAIRRKTRNATRKVAQAGVYGREGSLAHLVEFGTAAHAIAVKTKRVLRSKSGKIFGKVVRHPGARAKPFLRPAADTKKEQALAKMADSLRRGIERMVERIRVKGK